MKKLLIAAAAALAVSGCAEPFNARVSRFQQLPAPQGQSFYVQAADPAQMGGLEFSQYANLVAAELTRQGYRQAADPASAELVVKFRYGVDRGREKVVSSPGFGYGYGFPYGGFYWRRAFVYGFYDPFFYGPGFGGFGGFGGPDVRSYTVYTSELRLEIDRADSGQRLFEGTARAQSDTDDLTKLVPNLVEAMFTGFPGNSGQTVKITVAPQKKRA
ncbi:MAG: lipoprotein transmembrane [Proteobacteria bacterium SG_bin5]|nr:MAG: lipoprotein transmembrane [Proteobacteria bacterium SG_bin5]